LPPGLVSPSVKVLPVGDADLFGSPTHRALSYPLLAEVTAETAAAVDWTAYNVDDVRTLISTGDTCPDRGVSMMAVTKGKGWNWTLAGGDAHYAGIHMDTQYSGPQGTGWPVPNVRRNGYPYRAPYMNLERMRPIRLEPIAVAEAPSPVSPAAPRPVPAQTESPRSRRSRHGPLPRAAERDSDPV